MGHYKELIKVFQYINKFPDKRLRVDDLEPHSAGVRVSDKDVEDFTQQYPDAEEELDPRHPSPRGRAFETSVWFDSDHAHDKKTFRSITGLFVYVCGVPYLWKSKRQGAIQASTYAAEFMAGRAAVEEAQGIRYVLRSLGVPLKGPTALYGDCMGMIQSSSLPDGTLKKKHVAISYHTVREQVAAKAVELYKVDTSENIADLLTKSLSVGVLMPLCKKIWPKEFLCD